MREIKFRAWDTIENVMVVPENIINPVQTEAPEGINCFVLMQFTGLKDKNGKEIYEGDVVRWRNPYRTTQTHTGDNIPNGSYTEPMEPGIKIHQGDIQFKNGGFVVMNDDHDRFKQGVPIEWCGQEWTLEDIREAISYGGPDRFLWDDPEEGDLPYLIKEVAKVKDENELIEYFRGVEIIGNIYENSELLNHSQ